MRLEIFNPLGQRVAVLVDGEKEAGYHSAVLESRAGCISTGCIPTTLIMHCRAGKQETLRQDQGMVLWRPRSSLSSGRFVLAAGKGATIHDKRRNSVTLNNVLIPLIGSLFFASAATAQKETLDILHRQGNAPVGHRVSSEPVRPWEKPSVKSLAGTTEISAEGLVGYWPFNGIAYDESGNGNHGAVFGPMLTEDRFNNPSSAYSFDGVDDYIRAGDSDILRMGNAMSMMAWINPHLIHTSIIGIILNKEGEYEFARFITDEVYYAITNDYPGWYWVPTGYEARSDEWSHIAIVYDSGLATMYVNGELFFIFSGSGTIGDAWTNFNELRFGGRQGEGGDQFFKGVIDDIRIYNRALSAEEVQEIYNEVLPDSRAQFGVCYGATGSSEPTNPGSLITIDPLTGAGTLVGPTGIVGDEGPSVPTLAIKSTGEMYALGADSSSDLYLVNASTGTAAFIAATGLASPDALAFDANDVLYAVANNNNLYTVNITTGTTSLIGPMGFTTKALSNDPTDGTMYGSSVDDRIYTVDLATGASTLVGSTGLGGSTHALYFDPQGNLYGTKGSSTEPYTLISIDKLTGIGTTIGPIGFTAVIGLASKVVITTGVDEDGSEFWDDDKPWGLPAKTVLFENFPNPFNPSTTIRYALGEEAHVTVKIYNILGQVVATLVDEPQTAGYGSVVWNGRNESGAGVASGMYVYRMTAGGFTDTKRMLLLK